MTRYVKWIFVFCVGLVVPLQAAVLLPEGFVLNGISGVAVKGETSGDWSFVPSAELTYMKTVVEKGTPQPILPSSGYDQLQSIAKDKTEIHIRVWGILTQYNKKNYLFPIQVLPLMTPAPVPVDPEPKHTATAEANEVSEDPNSDDVIPAELLAILRSQERVDLAQLSQAVPAPDTPADTNIPQSREYSLIGKSGYITPGPTTYFVPDAFGRKIENAEYILLPCLTLETAQERLSRGLGKYRYTVSGIMTSCGEKKYLLLYRAVRTYSNRNFTP